MCVCVRAASERKKYLLLSPPFAQAFCGGASPFACLALSNCSQFSFSASHQPLQFRFRHHGVFNAGNDQPLINQQFTSLTTRLAAKPPNSCQAHIEKPSGRVMVTLKFSHKDLAKVRAWSVACSCQMISTL